MRSLQAQLLAAEENALSLISQGPEYLDVFNQTWSDLQVKLDQGIKEDTVDEETLALAHQVATRVELIAKQFLQLGEEVETFSTSLRTELDTIFAEMTLDETPLSFSLQLFPSRQNAEIPLDFRGATLPAYIRPAYTWLLQNLHNPYPSKDVKANIAKETGSPVKDVQNWFRDVRRRIGWSKLCKQKFSNKRSNIVHAAIRYYQRLPSRLEQKASTSQTNEKDLQATYYLDFLGIETRAGELYAATLYGTTTTSFDTVLNDSIPDPKSSLIKRRKHRPSPVLNDKPSSAFSYPSPERSPDRSPTPPSSRPPASECYGNRKKRRNSSDISEIDDFNVRDRKRARFDSCQISPATAMASLPSPFASESDLSQDSLTPPTMTTPPPPPVSPLAGKRKRRSSESHEQPPAKRVHNTLSGSRPQAVLNPLPMSTTLAQDYEWFRSIFPDVQGVNGDIPSPVAVGVPDETTLFEVTYHQYNFSPHASNVFLRPECEEEGDPAYPPDGSVSPSGTVDLSLAVEGSDRNIGVDFNTLTHDIQDADTDHLFEMSDIYLNWNFDNFTTPFSETGLFPSPITLPIAHDESFNALPSTNPVEFDWMSLVGPHSDCDSLSSLLLGGNKGVRLHDDSTSVIRAVHDAQILDDKIAKHERAQFLRDELQRLEADLHLCQDTL